VESILTSQFASQGGDGAAARRLANLLLFLTFHYEISKRIVLTEIRDREKQLKAELRMRLRDLDKVQRVFDKYGVAEEIDKAWRSWKAEKLGQIEQRIAKLRGLRDKCTVPPLPKKHRDTRRDFLLHWIDRCLAENFALGTRKERLPLLAKLSMVLGLISEVTCGEVQNEGSDRITRYVLGWVEEARRFEVMEKTGGTSRSRLVRGCPFFEKDEPTTCTVQEDPQTFCERAVQTTDKRLKRSAGLRPYIDAVFEEAGPLLVAARTLVQSQPNNSSQEDN